MNIFSYFSVKTCCTRLKHLPEVLLIGSDSIRFHGKISVLFD